MTDNVFFGLYLLLTTIQLYGAGLFLWWWHKSRWRATSMYVYITLLFAFSGFRNIIDTLAFYDRVIDNDNVTWVYNHWIWQARLIPAIVISAVIVGHMSYRVFVQRNKINETKVS